MSNKIVCSQCVSKQEDIYRLREEIGRLKAKLRNNERKTTEGFFGSSTPSSQKPVKSNTTSEKKNGGAKKGHKGAGRKVFPKEEADVYETIETDDTCPDCLVKLNQKDSRDRYVIDIKPLAIKKIIYHIIRKKCKKCGRIFEPKPPGVMPRNLYGNHLIAHIAIEHYIKGKTLGALEKELGIGFGTLIDILHSLAKIIKDIPDKLIAEYRKSLVKHAGIQYIQNIFRENKDKLYHWANNRNIPADNNFAERQLRPLIIARKLSFGSQSDAGAKTRETLMTVLLTLKNREKQKTASKLKSFLDTIAANPDIDTYNALFPDKSS